MKIAIIEQKLRIKIMKNYQKKNSLSLLKVILGQKFGKRAEYC